MPTPRKTTAAAAKTAKPAKATTSRATKPAPKPARPRKATATVPTPVRTRAPRSDAAATIPGGYNLGVQASEPLYDLTVPSGARCQVRRPGVQGLIRAGLLDNFDSLTALVQTKHIEPNAMPGRAPRKVTKAESEARAKELAGDPEELQKVFGLVDKMCVYVLTQPKFWIDYQMEGEPDNKWDDRRRAQDIAATKGEQLIGIRNVDLIDKMFIMNWAVGGTSDLETFRVELGGSLGNLADLQGVSLQA